MSRRRWFQFHSLTGSISGLMLFVICWSGTFAVVSNEIDWLLTPEARVETQGEQRSWGQILAAVEAAYPGASVKSLHAPLYAASAATAIVSFPEQRNVRIYVDPHTGEILGRTSYFTVHRFFRDFHRKLFVPGAGRYVILVFSLFLVASLVTALMFYKRWWLGFLRLPRARGRLFWSEMHKFAGAWSIWFLVVIGVTGTWYLYEMGQRDLLGGKINYVGGEVRVPAPASDPALPPMPLDELVARASSGWPGFEITKIRFRPSSTNVKTVQVEGQTGFPLVRDRANQVRLDPRSGNILWRNAYRDLPGYWLWMDMADPIHFGSFGGLASKLVWFVFGLNLSGLILTGAWLHVRRIVREAGKNSQPPSRMAAVSGAISILVVLGLSVPFGLAEARSFGPLVDNVRQLPDIAPGVLAFIAGWTALTLGIIVTWTVLVWRLGFWRLASKPLPVRP